MKKIFAAMIALILIGTSSYAALPGENVEIRQDKKGNIAVKADQEIKQIRCFNDAGNKMALDVGKNKKEVRLGNNLEKGTWYFQVRTVDGKVSIKKVDIH
jgi:hypothetical protein